MPEVLGTRKFFTIKQESDSQATTLLSAKPGKASGGSYSIATP